MNRKTRLFIWGLIKVTAGSIGTSSYIGDIRAGEEIGWFNCLMIILLFGFSLGGIFDIHKSLEK